ncbi:MAG: hypothetical protein U0229_10405 [Anaeromyxobacter sp.]
MEARPTLPAALVLIVLGLARGAGGVALLVGGPAAVGSAADEGVARLLGAVLVAVGAMALAAGFAALRGRPAMFPLALGAVVLHVFAGFVNGAIRYGRASPAGTVANLGVGLLALWLLRRARP